MARRLAVALLVMVGLVVVTSARGGATGAAPCPRTALALVPGPRISPATGEWAIALAVRNVGAAACTVEGGTRVTLLDAARRALPVHPARVSQYVRRVPVRRLTLRPGQPAYLIVAQYRCDIGVADAAARLVLRLGAGPRAPVLVDTGSAPRHLALCRGGKNAPGGNVLTVTPLAARFPQLLP